MELNHRPPGYTYGTKMLRPTIRFSRSGIAAAGLFLLLAVVAFAWVFFIASKNPADSGESAIILLPLAMPWIMIVPSAWIGPLTGLGCILLNSLILYFLFGGLRTKNAPQTSSDHSPPQPKEAPP